MAARKDDALRWDGDDDPTLASAPVRRPAASVPAAAGDSAVGDAEVPDPDAAPAPMGNATLVTLGVFGGIYLLLTIGWFIGGSRLQFVASLFVDPAAHIAAWILAVLAAPVWFTTSLVITRSRPAWLRFAALGGGALVLIPWPFLLTGIGA